MSAEISERAFEEAIECGLLRGGPDACAGDAPLVHEPPAARPGGLRSGAEPAGLDEETRRRYAARSFQ